LRKINYYVLAKVEALDLSKMPHNLNILPLLNFVVNKENSPLFAIIGLKNGRNFCYGYMAVPPLGQESRFHR